MPTLDHISLGIADHARATAFYDAVLAPLGIVRRFEEAGAAGYGATGDRADFWIGPPHDGRPATAGNGVHVCFAAPSRAAVDAFHRAALAHGGTDDGAPGLRPEYHPDYYGAFARDPDGNKIEAVCRTAP